MTPQQAYAILEDMYSLELAEPEVMAVIKAALSQPEAVTVNQLWNWFENEEGNIYKLRNKYPNGLIIVEDETK